MLAGSSETCSIDAISQPSPRQNATTAGPDKSSRSPLLPGSLSVRTATPTGRVSCGAPRRLDRIAVGFFHQPHGFHQQPGGIARRGRLVEAFAALKSISNSPAVHRTTL